MLADEIERIYEANVDALYAFVFYRVGGAPEVCEDVVHDTFALAMDRFGEFDSERGSVRTWLCTLSRNVIRRHLRTRKREQLGDIWDRIDRELVNVFAELERRPLSDEVVEREETRTLVNMTVTNLPDRYREALEQKYVAGQSLAEMARDRSVSEDAVKSLLARARRAFRDAFAAVTRAVVEGSDKNLGALWEVKS